MKERTYNNFLVVRPIIDGMKTDYNGMPIIKMIDIKKIDEKNVRLTNFKNLNSIIFRNNTIVDMFNYDETIESIWRNPFKYIAKFSGVLAIASPDYSVYPNMNRFEIEHNVFKNRWLGAFFQCYNLEVIPTVTWAGEDTYDICFSGLEKGTPVIISTLGVGDNKTMFLNGFNELKKRIDPRLIILVGKIIDGMTGRFLSYKLSDTFNQRKSVEQLSFFGNTIIEIKGGESTYGW